MHLGHVGTARVHIAPRVPRAARGLAEASRRPVRAALEPALWGMASATDTMATEDDQAWAERLLADITEAVSLLLANGHRRAASELVRELFETHEIPELLVLHARLELEDGSREAVKRGRVGLEMRLLQCPRDLTAVALLRELLGAQRQWRTRARLDRSLTWRWLGSATPQVPKGD